ncbi:hypothetical protein [Lactobacillus kitasatonis]|uniref:RiboL-PSP-HEPN domain-containing protein n=1 Tax=Lactobacillus kitasatonis DSM 16761 = JCM 1039 TaxID=1423767 RepID=A0A0R1VED4_9LACO|nr:hypothetical protein [Lactobacillus kitasatonis]KRM03850.1 hypothetical protein FC59_GL001023 [Lactobacillus kitasatonis DSM 16761 = JCM 1039]
MDVNKIIIEYLKLIIDLLHYAGWPILIFIIFMYYRKKIPLLVGDLLPRIKKITFNKISVEFVQKVNELKNFQQNYDVKESVELKEYLYNPEFRQLLRVRSDFSILASWQDIEMKLRQMGINPYTRNKSQKLVQKYDFKQSKLILHLKDLRSEVVHNNNIRIPEETALEYRKACFEALQALDKLEDSLVSKIIRKGSY